MIGKTVSHYKIISKLGEGGMGVVYKAEDTRLGRHVAIKFLPPQLSSDNNAKKRFIREAKAASALNHANIAVVHEIDETPEGRTFIVMACYEGQTLKDRLESGPLNADEAIAIVSQVASGLSKAHEKGILHRDIKPGNILMGEDGQAKLADFGLATLAGQTKITKTGTTVGTVAYMSPEQARGEDADRRADIWSLGVILYEMLAGQLPFGGQHEHAVTYQIIHEDPKPITEIRAGIPASLEGVANKCLEKEPANRYEHVGGVLADLGGEIVPSASRPTMRLSRYALPVSVLLLAVVVLIVFNPFQWFATPNDGAGPVKLAVLPFENLGEPEDEYFADGVTDEITSKLAVLSGLAVISRTSATKYKNTDKGLPEIGEELGVDYVLEGTIRWDKSGEIERVRITPQLINVSDDFHLWAENYERDMTQIFTVQADIASRIVEALGVSLLASERHAVGAMPTEDLDAYQAYLRGVDLSRQGKGDGDTKRLGIQMLERAVELDPEFALAFAALSEAHSLMYFLRWDPTEERLSLSKAAAEKALELQPDLPEAHLALALYHFHGNRDYKRAVEELSIAEKGLPNDSRIVQATGRIWARQGKFEAAVGLFEAAFELNPRDDTLARQMALSYVYLRRGAEADRCFELAISLAPDHRWAYGNRAYNYISWLGDTKRARDALEKMPGDGRDVDVWWLGLWVLERNYQAVLDFVSSDSQPLSSWTALMAAKAYRLKGEAELAHASYDSARSMLEENLAETPDDYSIHRALGIAYAGLGRKEEAIREGKRGVELVPVSKDAFEGPKFVWDLAVIYMMVGEYDASLDEIEYVLTIPFGATIHNVRIDPIWDPLRENPRYQALLEKYGAAKPQN